ncbi:MAG TPA: integrase [Nitrososphaera sp.]
MTAKTAEDRLRYSKQYGSVLTSPSSSVMLLQLPANKRIHVMKALSCLARYTGRTEQWRAIRQQYQLTWSTGTEKIDAFTRFFDSEKSLDNMLQWLREAIRVLPSRYANLLLFCTLTGMRGSEAVESIRLLNSVRHGEHKDTRRNLSGSPETGVPEQYHSPERQILQHYLYPNIFIRRTKAIYISIVNDQIIALARNIGKTPTLNGLKKAISHSKLSMQIKYCRKIFASYLKQHGIDTEIINMLQGRIGKDIFLRHYMTPSSNFKNEVLTAIAELQRQIQNI